MIPQWLEELNVFSWVAANILIAYIAVVLVIFVIAYVVLFDPRATTAGRYIFRFFVSLVGVIGLIFISTFIDPAPHRVWDEHPDDVLWWRPLIRVAVYFYVAYTVTGLALLLALRKFKPQWLRTVHDRELVKPRNT